MMRTALPGEEGRGEGARRVAPADVEEVTTGASGVSELMAMTLPRVRIGVLLTGSLLLGCAPRVLVSHGHGLDPLRAHDCSVRPDGARIVCDGQELARIGCLSEHHTAFGNACRVLAVRYADGDIAWLYRAARFDPEHPEEYRPPDKVDLDRASSPVVARDGHAVWFHSRTIFTRGSVQEYDVASGRIRDVESADEWRIWAAVHEGRAVRVGGQPAPEHALP